MCIAAAAGAPAILSLIGTGVSAAVSMYGQYQQGKAAEAQYKYQAGVARNNQIIAEQNAQDAIQRGKVDVADHRRKVNQIKGSQRAGFGASGVVLDSGSPLDIVADTAMMGELDAQTISNNAEREARNYRIQGTNFGAEAGMLQSSAKSARSAANIGMAGTLLGGATTFADKWYQFKRQGAF